MHFWRQKYSRPDGRESFSSVRQRFWPGLRRPTGFVPGLIPVAILAVLIAGFILTPTRLPALPAWAQTGITNNGSTSRTTLDPVYGVGSWIWTHETHDQQLCRLWKSFEIPRSTVVINARLRISADNSYRLFLDGREIGRGGDWRDMAEYDLTLLLEPGKHVLAVEGFNDFDAAGVLLGLSLKLGDGRVIEVGSDQSWKVAPNTRTGWEKVRQAPANWPPATVVQVLGGGRWTYRPHLFKTPQLQPIITYFWQTGWFSVTLLSLCVVAMMVCLRLMGKLAMHAQSHQILSRERTRIARDLHDDLTAGLTQLVLLGEVARKELPDQSPSQQQVARVCDRARGLSRSLNETIWLVNSQRDTFQDFASYICRYAETFLQTASIRCRFEVEEALGNLPCDLGVRRNLFLAVKEALNNVVRHAEATEVTVRIKRQGETMWVAIEDNGKGFVPAEADRNRNGLSNLMKRTADAGGTSRIHSQPGFGSRIEFIVPWTRPRQGRWQYLIRSWQGWHPFSPRSSPPSAATTPPSQPSNPVL
jgi:signal transduction histidine kinase